MGVSVNDGDGVREDGVPPRGRRRGHGRSSRREGSACERDGPHRRSGASGIRNHDRDFAGVFPAGTAPSRRPVGRDRPARSRAGGTDRTPVRGRREPAGGIGSFGRSGLDAGDDGHHPQHGRDGRHGGGAGEDDGRRAPRAGCLPPADPGLRRRGAGHPQGPLRNGAGSSEATRRRGVRLRTGAGRAAGAHRGVQGNHPGDDRRAAL